MTRLERVVTDAEDGTRADVLVTGWLGESRGQIQRWFDEGLVRVDGVVVAKSRRLAEGARVVVSQAEAPAAVDATVTAVPVRYEDDDLAVIAKPAGLIVHAGAGTRGSATLVDALRAMGMTLAEGGDPDRPGIVHRLDRGTSGLLVVAKSEAARIGLVATFAAHDVDRRYWAVVDGVPSSPSATVDAPIGRSGRNRTKFTIAEDGRRAVTHYDVVTDAGRAAVLNVRLETGRTHQVRVHLSAVGHPVTGDSVYGASPTLARELGLTRPALHATRLGFAHPVTGERVVVDERLPDDLAAALARL